ncbi:MAG TPA: methyltransferase domain-containing protein [Allosphingosinicella sp.]|nr:methyltransferase domain-containing protein [Allosphingosinicella sp.]
MSDAEVTDAGGQDSAQQDPWSRYWQSDRIASCMDGADHGNYDERTASGWRHFFGSLAGPAKLLDLCSGNGAVALIAAEVSRTGAKGFHVVAVDQAEIDPARFVTRHSEDLGAIEFRGRVLAEELPFPDREFGAVASQFGIEYSDLSASLPEAMRILIPGGRFRLVMHAEEGTIREESQLAIKDCDFLLDEVDLPGAAARCAQAVRAVEAGDNPSQEDYARGDEAFRAFAAALERSADYMATANDKGMIQNVGAVLFDAHDKRGYFDLPELLEKIDQVRQEIFAHRARSQALVDAAVSAEQAEELAARLRSLGASEAAVAPLQDPAGALLAYVIEGRRG